MRRGVLLLALAGVVVASVAAAAFVGAVGPSGATRLEPPGSAADRGRPGGRQHGPVRVREPEQAGHGHDRRELHPVRGSGGRSELLPVRSDSPVRDPRRQRRGCSSGHHLSVQVQDDRLEPEHVPLQHGSGHVPERPGPERQADVHDREDHPHRLDAGDDVHEPGSSRGAAPTSARARTRSTT